MEFAEELRASLQDLLAGANVEIRENGSRVTATAPISWGTARRSGKAAGPLSGER